MRFFTTLALLAGTALVAVPDKAAARRTDEPVLAPATAEPSGPLLARRGRGTDDPPGHDAGDDRGRRGKNSGKGRGRGADDPPGHTFLLPDLGAWAPVLALARPATPGRG